MGIKIQKKIKDKLKKKINQSCRFSINTFKFVNNQGKETFFRWRFESDLGEQGLTDQEV